jgi:hypothetical protein
LAKSDGVNISIEPLPESAPGQGSLCSSLWERECGVQGAGSRSCNVARRQERLGRCHLHPDGWAVSKGVSGGLSPGPTPVVKTG